MPHAARIWSCSKTVTYVLINFIPMICMNDMHNVGDTQLRGLIDLVTYIEELRSNITFVLFMIESLVLVLVTYFLVSEISNCICI